MTASAPALVPRGGRKRGRFSFNIPNERNVFALIGFVGLLLVWQAATGIDLDPNRPGVQGLIKKLLMSSPLDIFNQAVTDFSSGEIWPHIAISFQEWSVGFLLAIAVGIPFGFALGWFRRFRLFTTYWLFAVDATPSVALFPLIVLVLGIGIESKYFMVFLASIFQITISTMTGVRSVSFGHLQIAQSFRANTRLLLRSVVLPSTVPFVLTGIRLGSARSLVGVVVAEFQASNQGLGYWISLSGQTLQTSRVFIGLVMLGAFGVIVGEIVRVVEKRFDVWRPAIHR